MGSKSLKCLTTSIRAESPCVDDKKIFSSKAPSGINSMWVEDEGYHNLIKSCAILSNALGICKSFSMTDIVVHSNGSQALIKHKFASEFYLNSYQHQWESCPLDRTSSMIPIVGELSSTSQLPSPQGSHSINSLQFSTNTLPTISNPSPVPTQFNVTDLMKMRESFLRKRIMSMNCALEKMSKSAFNLDRMAMAATQQYHHCKDPGPKKLIVPTLTGDQPDSLEDKSTKNYVPPLMSTEREPRNRLTKDNLNINLEPTITISELERNIGKPLSKFERNMMIFNWLHSLDSTNSAAEDE